MSMFSYRFRRIFFFLVACIIVAAFIFPIFWVYTSALKTHTQAIAIPPVWFPTKPIISNFIEIFVNEPFLKYLGNSLLVAVGSSLVVMTLALPASYALARFKIKGKNNIFLLVFQKIHLIDTHIGLILAHTTFNLPIAIWLLRMFIVQIPSDIDEAARVDGYTSMQTIRRVIIPLIMPALMATFFLVITFSWNEFMFGLMLAPYQAKTLPSATVGILGFGSIHWAVVSAAITIMTIPMIIYLLIAQKNLTKGLALGSV